MKPEDWPWDLKVLKLLDALGIPVHVLPEDVFLTDSQLRSSPGDSVWDGCRLLVERSAKEAYVVHEAAHFVVASVERPDEVRWPNYGYDSREFDSDAERDGLRPWDVDKEEATAAYLTCGFQMMMGLPWRETAELMSLTPSDVWQADEKKKERETGLRNNWMSRNAVGSTWWDGVEAEVVRRSAPYIGRVQVALGRL